MSGRLINKWIIIAAFGLTGIIFILFWLHYRALIKSKENADWVSHTYVVIRTGDKLLNTMLDAETGARGFIITRNEEYLQPFYGSKDKSDELLSQLKQLTTDNAAQQQLLNSIGILCNERFDRLNDAIDKSRHTNLLEQQQQPRSNRGKTIMDSLRTAVALFQSDEQSLLKQRNDKVERSTSFSYETLLISTVFILLIVMGMLVMLYREELKRRKTEKELFISREWFSKTLLSMGDGVIATNANGIISFMNKAAESLTGWNAIGAVGKPMDYVFEIINETTGNTVVNPIKVALTENRVVLLANHTILIRKDKTRLYIDDSAAPIHNDEGTIIGGVLIFRDVSEQSIAQKKLAESENKLSGIINNTAALIYIKDLEGRYLMVNNRLEKIFNITKEQITGKTDFDLFSADFADKTKAHIATVIASGKLTEIEEETLHPDGSLHTYLSSKFPLYDEKGHIYAVCNVSIDITERKRAEREIKLMNDELEKRVEQKTKEVIEREKRLHSTLDQMLEGVQIIDSNWRYVYVNNAVAGQGKYSPAELMGHTMMEKYPGIENTELFSTLKKCMAERTIHHMENEFYYPDNSKGWFELSIQPAPEGIFILSVDITRRKRTETETLELIEQLQNRNKDLRQFAYIVSHNLRAPIAKIQGLASLIETGSNDTEEDSEETEILNNITREAVHLDNVVKDLNMIISTRDSGGELKEYIAFDEQVTLIKQVLENEINDSRANITTDFSALKGMKSVKSYVYSIIYNLISNAIKYRSPERPLHIHIKTQTDDKYTWLIVQDNGLGIDLKRNADKVFGLYKRFHDHVEGKGIGLHLVKTQAETLGGGVEIDSRLNEGTTFKIFFK